MSLADQATTFYSQGQLRKAEDLQMNVMMCWREALGRAHPYTRSIMSNLEWNYRSQGRPDEAESLALDIAEICKQSPGLHDSDILASISRQASRGSPSDDSINGSAPVTSEKASPRTRHNKLAMNACIFRRIRAHLKLRP